MKTDPTSLDQLHDIITPTPVPWWPPAPAWYWVLAFATLVLFFLLLKGLVRWQRNRYRREALSALKRQQTAVRHDADRAAAILAISDLLKRTALTAFPRERVAALTGVKWFAFLDRTAPGTAFSDGTGALLEQAVYDPRTATQMPDTKLDELTTMVRRWIQTHSIDPHVDVLDDPTDTSC